MAATGFTPIQIYYSTTASAVPTAGNLLPGELALNIADMKLYCENGSGVVTLLASASGASGDVVGPASATDNAVVRFDGTTGKLVQNSAVTIADTTGDITGGAYNKVTITAPATSATLTIANGKTLTANSSLTLAGVDAKTLTVNNSLTLAGTDATVMTFPSTSATIARTDAGQTFTGTQVMTSPRIITSVNDTNGNEVFAITATASAVNDFTLVNAATGNNPQIQASGNDTNIGINLVPKGTGTVQANGVEVATISGTQALTNKTINGSNNTITNVSLTTAVTGTLPVANGGTGQTSYTDGQLLIGNTATSGLSKATLTAGSNITITNGNGTITIASTNPGGDVVGPASATDNAIVRFDGTTGKLVQNSAVTVADTTGDITGGAYNKVTITAPATSATLTIADSKTLTANSTLTLAGVDAKTLTVNNSLTLSGTDGTVMTFPSTSATIARTDAGQTFTGTQVMTSPRIVTSLNDTNGNEVFAITATASAVNDFTLVNAATGNNPQIQASGSDSNIGINLVPKGTGTVQANGVPVVTTTGTQTLTNKRIDPRVSSTASISSPLAWNSDNFDLYAATAQAADLTINADSGTPVNGQKIIFRFKDNGTARALTWTTGSSKSFQAVGITLPTTTVINKTTYVGCIYNAADDRWDAVATVTQA